MIKLFDDEAAAHSVIRAEVVQEQGDDAGYAVWKRVLQAINELKGTEPTETPNQVLLGREDVADRWQIDIKVTQMTGLGRKRP